MTRAHLPGSAWTQNSALPARQRRKWCYGFSVIELLIVAAILATLASIALPAYRDALDKAKITRAVGDIGVLAKEITVYQVYNEKLPDTLDEVGRENLLDPYGNTYEYLNLTSTATMRKKAKRKLKRKMRKDRFLVPLNSDFDLYSRGKDGKSKPSLRSKNSWDDIVRANDGAYIGLASDY